MLNKLKSFMENYRGEKVVCAVSGGADSMALLWGMYLLRETLELDVSAAHFNHGLRGAESDRDEAFVRDFCHCYQIPFISGSAVVTAGKKGLEAAAREARYAFLKTLPGKIATAHTADDNAETVLMHLVRGTGLKGLGGIQPVNKNLIRPMLQITRAEVEAFLTEFSIFYVEDSSNGSDDFLRNRIRHHVMPLLKQENPGLAQNLSAMAMRLRQDEAALEKLSAENMTDQVGKLRDLEPAIRSRVLSKILLDAGVREPEAEHIAALEKLVFSEKPSARAQFPAGITIARNYGRLQVRSQEPTLQTQELTCPGICEFPGGRIICEQNTDTECTTVSFPVAPKGKMLVRCRQSGDTIRLHGGTKSLKKLFIDAKIPAAQRDSVAVIADDHGVLGVAGFGGNLNRIALDTDAARIKIEYL